MAWGFFVPMLPWTGSSFSLPMPYMFPSCAISSHRLSKIQHQNRTPSFRFLRVSTTCGPLALSHAARLSKNFPFLCLGKNQARRQPRAQVVACLLYTSPPTRKSIERNGSWESRRFTTSGNLGALPGMSGAFKIGAPSGMPAVRKS